MSDTQEEISTEPDLAPAGGGGPPPPPGQSSQRSPSRALLGLKAAHVIGAVGLTGYNIPFAQEMYRAGDWKPAAAIVVAIVLIATRAGFADVGKFALDAAKQLLPWGKK